MAKDQYVGQLNCGGAVDCTFCIVDPRASSGNGPHKFVLSDRTGDIPAKLLPSGTRLAWEEIRAARYAHVTGRVEYSDYIKAPEVTVRTFTPVDPPDDLDDYMKRMKGDVGVLSQELRALVLSVKDPHLRELLDRLFLMDPEFRRAYFEAPAAQRRHHPYKYGLMEHSVEVARLCDAISKIVPGLSRDLLVTAALLHDMGKIEEMDRIPGYPFTRQGGMLGHVFLGAARVRSVLDGIEGCPADLADALCHLLLSHQGKLEWGAPVRPCFAEAYVLHAADELSARAFHFRQNTSGSAGRDFDYSSDLDAWVYRGAFSWGVSTAFPVSQAESEPIGTGYAGQSMLRMVDGGTQDGLVLLPLRGSIAAGLPVSEEEWVEEAHPVSGSVREGDYLLRVRGDSMTGAHILDGDLVHVRPQRTAESGDIVVGLVDGESTLKRLVCEEGRAYLRAENPAYPEIRAAEALEIQGKVVGVIRAGL